MFAFLFLWGIIFVVFGWVAFLIVEIQNCQFVNIVFFDGSDNISIVLKPLVFGDIDKSPKFIAFI